MKLNYVELPKSLELSEREHAQIENFEYGYQYINWKKTYFYCFWTNKNESINNLINWDDIFPLVDLSEYLERKEYQPLYHLIPKDIQKQFRGNYVKVFFPILSNRFNPIVLNRKRDEYNRVFNILKLGGNKKKISPEDINYLESFHSIYQRQLKRHFEIISEYDRNIASVLKVLLYNEYFDPAISNTIRKIEGEKFRVFFVETIRYAKPLHEVGNYLNPLLEECKNAPALIKKGTNTGILYLLNKKENIIRSTISLLIKYQVIELMLEFAIRDIEVTAPSKIKKYFNDEYHPKNSRYKHAIFDYLITNENLELRTAHEELKNILIKEFKIDRRNIDEYINPSAKTYQKAYQKFLYDNKLERGDLANDFFPE